MRFGPSHRTKTDFTRIKPGSINFQFKTIYRVYEKCTKISFDHTKCHGNTGRKENCCSHRAIPQQNGLASEIKNFAWEFNLVKDQQVNAFCMPGGKIVVYEGLMKLVSSDDELAVVIGHEVAHAVAKHSNERMSQEIMAQYGAQILGSTLVDKSQTVQSLAGKVYGIGAQYGVMLPFSRKHETEADYMGLIFMTMAGYNPDVAITFWQKMSAAGGSSVPEFMSTHPSDARRISEIQQALPAIKAKFSIK